MVGICLSGGNMVFDQFHCHRERASRFCNAPHFSIMGDPEGREEKNY
jgi:hypothetical protein